MVFEIDGIDARLERAKENIINLAAEISAFLRGVCDEIAGSDEPPIPSRLGAWAGESIYLMRSALDHLAWQLVIAAGGEPGQRTAFPVFALDPARNEESLAKYDGCVEGMSDTAKVRVQRLQPYHRHGRRKQNVLWILDDLSSTDQHTGLVLRFNTYRQRPIPTFSADETQKASRFADDEGTISITASAAATTGMKEDGEGTAYLSFARFGKLTDVAVVDGLWLLWHATNGICASFAVELTGPSPELTPILPKESRASNVIRDHS
jgi:hypothetical protein